MLDVFTKRFAVKTLFWVITAVLIFSCSKSLEIDLQPGVKEILVDISQPQTFQASQFFDTCIIVPLDDRELVGRVDEVFFDEKGILLTDKSTTQKIYFFDWNGLFQKYIGVEGVGPGEYKFHRDIQIINDSEVVIYSNATNKLTFESLIGRPPKDFPLDSLGPLGDYKAINGKNYFLREKPSGKNGQILIFDSKFSNPKEIQIDDQFLSQDNSEYGLSKNNFIFPKPDKNGFYFSDVNTPYFLDFENDQLQTVFKVKISEREIDYSRIDISTDRSAIEIAKEQNLIYFNNVVQIHPDFLFLGYTENIISKMAIWDKKGETAFPVKKIENDISIFPNINSIGQSAMLNGQPGYHIFLIEAAMLVDVLDQIEEKDNKYLQRVRDMNIQKDDNPIIFFFRFKEKVDFVFP